MDLGGPRHPWWARPATSRRRRALLPFRDWPLAGQVVVGPYDGPSGGLVVVRARTCRDRGCAWNVASITSHPGRP